VENQSPLYKRGEAKLPLFQREGRACPPVVWRERV